MARAGALCVLRGCGHARRAGLPLCDEHWNLVPRELRAAEFAALTNRDPRRRRDICRQAVVAVMEALRNGTDDHVQQR